MRIGWGTCERGCVHVCVRACMCARACASVCERACGRFFAGTDVCRDTHAHTHTHTHAHTHTCTHVRDVADSARPGASARGALAVAAPRRARCPSSGRSGRGTSLNPPAGARPLRSDVRTSMVRTFGSMRPLLIQLRIAVVARLYCSHYRLHYRYYYMPAPFSSCML